MAELHEIEAEARDVRDQTAMPALDRAPERYRLAGRGTQGFRLLLVERNAGAGEDVPEITNRSFHEIAIELLGKEDVPLGSLPVRRIDFSVPTYAPTFVTNALNCVAVNVAMVPSVCGH